METKIMDKDKALVKPEVFKKIILATTLGVILIYISFINYLLFHTVIEVATVIFYFSVSIIAINTYKISNNSYFTFLGISFAFSGFFNLLHALTYKGIGIFYGDTANLATQLWIITRFLQSVSLLIAFTFIEKKLKEKTSILIYLIISIFLLLSVFLWGIFPDCYVTGVGLTLFKKLGEYVIALISIASILILMKNKKAFDKSVYTYMIFSLAIMIVSEIFFTLYSDVFDISNMIGHVMYAVSSYLMYKVVSTICIKNPYELLFYQLSETNQALKLKAEELEKSNEKLKIEIRKHRITENELIISEKRYKTLVDNLPDAIFVHVDGEIQLVNDEAKKLLGASDSSEIQGKMLSSFIHKDYHSLLYKRLDNLKEESSIVPIVEEKFIKLNGQIVDVDITSTCSVKEGKNVVISVVRDITERKLLNEVIEYDNLKREFFANISHEFRTPLNIIHATVQFIEKYIIDDSSDNTREKLERNIKSVKHNCYRLLRLVNNLIDSTKIDSGFLKLSLTNCNIVNVIEEITLSVAQYVETKKVRLVFDTDVEEKIMACDIEKMERIMLNLLSNAVKFTNPGDDIFVLIEDRGESIIISVRDTGIGIPKQKLEVIFDKFRQVDKSLTRNHEGSGMGLSIVKALVDMQGGKITVNSKYGEGSEFKMQFPTKVLDFNEADLEIAADSDRIDPVHIEFSDIYF
ncbi:ATP-binding protein [Clostridium sp. CX1]|uniref:histidine kinase n=1 Tax=Clostridium tanneri TaxID=3037988 RepID=A0ABU4JTQ8_9CLOT|nr:MULTISPECIES: MASE3 domain-containing protein [unclassified Clostridium]MCT8975659.1 ATP-binding protein [Clostridium sp. CX1]MDW8801536.1 MASE3 domain-containing protein [Clostridium sp. A1-XYC3]